MIPIILGSQSPRRKQILEYFSLPFEQASSAFNEEAVPFDGNPIAYVNILAKGKALDLKDRYPNALIITADTTVSKGEKVYNKPANNEEAIKMILELAGLWHSVYTGVAVSYEGVMYQAVEETKVLFNNLTLPQIEHYVASMHLADKAGSYAIQNAGGLIVRKIDGCFYNVMGLPINTVRDLLLKFGIDLWNYIR